MELLSLLYIFSVMVAAALLFIMVFFIIMCADLASDYINPIDMTRKLNMFVLPEYAAHGALTLLFLISMEWTSFILNVPLLAFHYLRFKKGRHFMDATEIFRELPAQQRILFIKLGFYLISFFYYLYRLVPFGKMGQYVSEKAGQAEKTEFDEDFKFLEAQTDATKEAVEGLGKKTEEYLQPDPTVRAKMNLQRKLNRGKNAGKKYPQPEGELGEVMLKGGSQLDTSSVFGQAMLTVGETEKCLADARHMLDSEVHLNFIMPMNDFCATRLKEVMAHRKKLSGRRLDYDAKRRKKDSNEQRSIDDYLLAEQKFQESVDICTEAMSDLVEDDAERVGQLLSLVEAQLNFHRTASEHLERCERDLRSKVSEASGRPRKERQPYQPQHGFDDDDEKDSTRHASGEFAEALYDFDAESENELSFRQGCSIRIINRLDENWLEGELEDGSCGIFPVSYISMK